jgi:transcriptional regulator with XRE-family HTH domain
MPIATTLTAWRTSRGLSQDELAARAGLAETVVQGIEAGTIDPTAGMLESVAGGLGVPVSWLHMAPRHLHLLTADEEDEPEEALTSSPDPVLDRMLQAQERDRELYVLLTALLQAGDAKLIRAAEVNLRSLIKQAKQASVPWQSRPPGHFEPPSD